MFKGNKKYVWLFVAMFAVVVVLQYFLPKPINWDRTYSRKDKAPFGTYAIHQLLKPSYAEKVIINSKTIYNLKSDSITRNALLLINSDIRLSPTDLKTLLEFVNNGNVVMLAGNNFYGKLADTLHINTRQKSFSYFMHLDSLIKQPGIQLKFCATNLEQKTYKYPMLCYDSYFSTFDTTRLSIVSVDSDNMPVVLRAQMGKGEVYLVSVPDVFANYFVVDHENREYPYTLLSMLSKSSDTIIWDEYYKDFNEKKDSPFKLIFENDALYSAYLLLIFVLLAHMIFDGRRRQRAIPVLEPVKNTTLEFVEVISHVFYNSKGHHHIAAERVKYFYDSIRSRFGLDTSVLDEHFFLLLSDLSGYDVKLIKQLFKYCARLKTSDAATEYDLIELNRQINNFNNNSLR